jgi:hypothetical protein
VTKRTQYARFTTTESQEDNDFDDQ